MAAVAGFSALARISHGLGQRTVHLSLSRLASVLVARKVEDAALLELAFKQSQVVKGKDEECTNHLTTANVLV